MSMAGRHIFFLSISRNNNEVQQAKGKGKIINK